MGYGLVVVTAPAAEPISLAEAKAQVRVDHSDSDSDLAMLISSARYHAEETTRRAFITQTLKMTLDGFPGEIRLPRNPVHSITSIKYLDTNGDQQALDSAAYRLDNQSIVARLTPSYGYSWPSTYATTNAVEITFVAGYGDASSDVPAPIRHAMLLMIATYYDQVRESVVLEGSPMRVPMSSKFLLGPYTIPEFPE